MSQHPSRSALGSGTDSGGGAGAEGGSVPSSLGPVVRDTRAASSLSGLSSASRNGTLQASPPAFGTNHSINHPMAQMGSAFQAGPLVPYGPMMPMPMPMMPTHPNHLIVHGQMNQFGSFPTGLVHTGGTGSSFMGASTGVIGSNDTLPATASSNSAFELASMPITHHACTHACIDLHACVH